MPKEFHETITSLPPIDCTENIFEKSQEISILDENSKNNGGTTNYYDLPQPDYVLLKETIKDFFNCTGNTANVFIELLQEEFIPNTLNDLIEHKNMPFWRGEILKACYGLEGRMEKNKEPEKAEERELNKIIYYANRRLKRIKKDK